MSPEDGSGKNIGTNEEQSEIPRILLRGLPKVSFEFGKQQWFENEKWRSRDNLLHRHFFFY